MYGSNTFLRKLTKRLDDLIQESSALKSNLIPQLKSLSNMVPEIVNFGISVCISADSFLLNDLVKLRNAAGAASYASP